MFRKRILSFLVIAVLTVTTVASAQAISAIQKSKNAIQIATDTNTTLSDENMAEDFKYTTAVSTNIPSPANVAQGTQTTETFSDAKTDIYNKMLNTIDYFNNVVLTMKTSMLSSETTTIEYQVDINANAAYQAVTEGERLVNETYSEENNMIFVSNVERTYTQNYLPTYTRSDTPYIPLASRITTASDGVPCYSYRRNVTNCPLASYCVFPQELAFSYLKDFDKWSIAGELTYLGRSCIKIIGTPAPYIATKHNIDSFEMIVDSATGILMDFSGTLNGAVTRYMTVTSCTFDSRAVIKQFDLADYSSYAENYRY